MRRWRVVGGGMVAFIWAGSARDAIEAHATATGVHAGNCLADECCVPDTSCVSGT